MNVDPEMLKAIESSEFPVLGIARLFDALAAEFLGLEADQKLTRGPHFIEAFGAIRALASSYTKVVETRTTTHIVN